MSRKDIIEGEVLPPVKSSRRSVPAPVMHRGDSLLFPVGSRKRAAEIMRAEVERYDAMVSLSQAEERLIQQECERQRSLDRLKRIDTEIAADRRKAAERFAKERLDYERSIELDELNHILELEKISAKTSEARLRRGLAEADLAALHGGSPTTPPAEQSRHYDQKAQLAIQAEFVKNKIDEITAKADPQDSDQALLQGYQNDLLRIHEELKSL